MENIRRSRSGQAVAPVPVKMDRESFEDHGTTEITWLGGSGALINSEGTCLMIDPVLSGFDMPMLIESPIVEEEVPHLDGILITHCDNDHYSRQTCSKLKNVCGSFHAPVYVAGLMKEELEIPASGHDIGDRFQIGNCEVTLTPAWHNWQNESEKHHTRDFQLDDYCGFRIDTPDGSVWAIGDSRLLPEQLEQETPDAILFDFSDSRWHITLEGAEKIAAAYPDTPLILWHWGSVDAPEWKEFNGDPQVLANRIVNPDRIAVPAPGEPWTLKKLK